MWRAHREAVDATPAFKRSFLGDLQRRNVHRAAVFYASAAYRSEEVLTNARDGMTHDVTHRRDGEHAEIVIPVRSDAQWAMDRSWLWNAAEFAERRKDSRVACEIELSSPHELSPAQRVMLGTTGRCFIFNETKPSISIEVQVSPIVTGSHRA